MRDWYNEPEYDDSCQMCGKTSWEEGWEEDGTVYDGVYCSAFCAEVAKTGELATPDEQAKISRLWDELENYKRNFHPAPVSLDDIFQNAPDGDFVWEEDDPGDPHAYDCGERDCPVGWHKAYYNSKMGRKDGKLFFELYIGDDDGNWDCDMGWDEGEDWSELGTFLASQLDEYFIGWAEYYLYCASNALDIFREGKDPLNDAMSIPKFENVVSFFLEAAEREVEYLTKV